MVPAEFTGTTPGTVNDVYVPAMMQAQAVQGSRGALTNPNFGWLRLIGRLAPGVPREQAQAALAILMDGSAEAPAAGKGAGKFKNTLLLSDGRRGHTDRVQDLALPLKLLMGVVGFVLVIACANVANLLLARASGRSREIAVRLAVGASRLRIVRQLLTESSILTVLGGGAGLLVAYGISGMLQGFTQQTNFVPRALDGRLDGRALAFTLALSLLTGIACALAPALQTSRPDFVAALKRDTAGRAGWRRTSLSNLLVVAQVALSLVVLIGAGLFIKSLRALQAIDPGFEPAKVMTASFDLGMSGREQVAGRQFVTDLSARVAALPGVEAVSFANIVAFSDLFWISGATIDGYVPAPGERLPFDFNAISPDYFRTLGTPILHGREFTARDTTESPRVIVINEVMARRYWPGQDAVGKRTSRGEVVGVVANSREKGLTETPRPAIYLAIQQSYVPQLTLHVRSAAEPAGLLAAVRREAQAIDATVPLYNVRTLAEQRDGALYTERVAAALLTLFGLVALLLAAVGLYGVLSHAVTERTREMGIRLAHGAQPRDLLRLVVGQGMRLTIVGLALGAGGAFALTRLVQRLLFGVSATDPLTFAGIAVLLIAVALLACWLPARRATRMDPLAALRYE